MGITGLLQALQPIATDLNIAALANKAVAIDAYCWLHRGAYACAMELAQNIKTDVFVNYCMKRAAMMIHHKVRPVFVFDGDYLPAKKGTEGERQQRREENKAKGMALLRAGNRTGALECFQKCIDVTPEMAFQLIQACRRENIEYVVAPYEADAQLAYLCLTDHVQAVVTEDSDLLVYNCSRVVFKMDQFGNGREIQAKYLCSRHGENGLDLEGWPHDRFRQLCIFAGCDYLGNVPGVGLKTAYKLLKKHGDAAKVILALRGQGTVLEPDYETKFQKAELTFKYHLVWDPRQQCVVPFTPYPLDPDFDAAQLTFAGPPFDPTRIVGHVRGDLNPFTGEPMVPGVKPDELSSQSQGLAQVDASDANARRTSPLAATSDGPAAIARVASASAMPSSSALFARYGTIKRPDTAPPQKNTLDSFVRRERKPVDVEASDRALAEFAPPARAQEPADLSKLTANPFVQSRRIKVASKYFVRPDQLTDVTNQPAIPVSTFSSTVPGPAANDWNSQSTDSLQQEVAAASEPSSGALAPAPAPRAPVALVHSTAPARTASPSMTFYQGLVRSSPSAPPPPGAATGRVSPITLSSSASSGPHVPQPPPQPDLFAADDEEIFIVEVSSAPAPPAPRIKLGLARPSSKATPPLKSPATMLRDDLSRFRFSPSFKSAPASPATPLTATAAGAAPARPQSSSACVPMSPSAAPTRPPSFFRSPSTPVVSREPACLPATISDPLGDSGLFASPAHPPGPAGSMVSPNANDSATPMEAAEEEVSPPRAASPVIPPKRASATAALAERFGFKRTCAGPRS
eukprot:m.7625 g.7625  ORF g.7625 m.7625 type:complete len:803 (+) comp5069_c0_seq1:158-2566(+)